jgi:ParB family transcriptional regulator, chromosome partitioning protein
LAQRVLRNDLTVRALERIVARGDAPAATRAVRSLSGDERAFENRLRERFMTHVTLVRYGRGGRIELRFSNEEELVRLGDVLLGEDHPA